MESEYFNKSAFGKAGIFWWYSAQAGPDAAAEYEESIITARAVYRYLALYLSILLLVDMFYLSAKL